MSSASVLLLDRQTATWKVFVLCNKDEKKVFLDVIYACVVPTSFPGSLFSASLSRWNRDPGCSWSRDHLSTQNRSVGGYSSTFGREDDKIPHPSSRFFYHPDSGWSRDQPQPGSLFQRLREAEKGDPGNEVAVVLSSISALTAVGALITLNT